MSTYRSKPPGQPWQAMPPGTRTISQVLGATDALTQLTVRVRESQARLAALQPLLPPAMRPQVKAGPVDIEGYTLLAGNQAVSAKLRQMLPALQAHLRSLGFEGTLRVKLMAP